MYMALAPAVAAARNRAGGEPGHGAQAGLKGVGLVTAVEMLRQLRGQCVFGAVRTRSSQEGKEG